MSEEGKQEIPKEGAGAGEEREEGISVEASVGDAEVEKGSVGEGGEAQEPLPGGGEQEVQSNVSDKEGDEWRRVHQHVVGVGQLLSYS